MFHTNFVYIDIFLLNFVPHVTLVTYCYFFNDMDITLTNISYHIGNNAQDISKVKSPNSINKFAKINTINFYEVRNH